MPIEEEKKLLYQALEKNPEIFSELDFKNINLNPVICEFIREGFLDVEDGKLKFKGYPQRGTLYQDTSVEDHKFGFKKLLTMYEKLRLSGGGLYQYREAQAGRLDIICGLPVLKCGNPLEDLLCYIEESNFWVIIKMTKFLGFQGKFLIWELPVLDEEQDPESLKQIWRIGNFRGKSMFRGEMDPPLIKIHSINYEDDDSSLEIPYSRVSNQCNSFHELYKFMYNYGRRGKIYSLLFPKLNLRTKNTLLKNTLKGGVSTKIRKLLEKWCF